MYCGKPIYFDEKTGDWRHVHDDRMTCTTVELVKPRPGTIHDEVEGEKR